jgi:hypothetical protein
MMHWCRLALHVSQSAMHVDEQTQPMIQKKLTSIINYKYSSNKSVPNKIKVDHA